MFFLLKYPLYNTFYFINCLHNSKLRTSSLNCWCKIVFFCAHSVLFGIRLIESQYKIVDQLQMLLMMVMMMIIANASES